MYDLATYQYYIILSTNCLQPGVLFLAHTRDNRVFCMNLCGIVNEWKKTELRFLLEQYQITV